MPPNPDDEGYGERPANYNEEPVGVVQHLRTFSDCKEFNIFIFCTIVLCGISLGIQTDKSLTTHPVLLAIDYTVVMIFVVEATIKIAAQSPKPWHYFYDTWNIFDFVVVVVGFIDLIRHSGEENVVIILRLFRLLRVLKVVRFMPQLRVIITCMFASLPSIGYISLILLLFFYVYGVLGVLLFQTNDPRYFGSLGTAMITLFRVMTCDAWSEILYINKNGCKDEYNLVDKPQCKDSQGFGIVAVVFFLSFIVLVTFIVLNLFVAVVAVNMRTADQESQVEIKKAHYTDAGYEAPEGPGEARHRELIQTLRELEDKVEEQARDIMELQDRLDSRERC